MLGFNDRGQEVLRRMRDTAKKPVLMRASGLRTLSPAAQTIYRLNACATDLFALAMPQKQPCGMEQTKNVVRLSSTVDTSQSICYNKRKLNRSVRSARRGWADQTETGMYS